MASENSGFTPAHLRWVVIGILGLAFMFIFKGELANMIKGVEKVSIGPEGIALETRTVETPLGKTIVSGPPTLETAGITQQTSPNYQSPKGYLINWPQDGSWSSHPEFAKALNLDLAIAYNQSWGNFVPNVNVTIEPTNTSSIQQWMDDSNPLFSTLGMTVTDVQVDEASGSGVRVLSGYFYDVETNMIQRIILHDGTAYIATATRPTSLNADPELWKDLNDILNSFRVKA